jgi:hypothetical protein
MHFNAWLGLAGAERDKRERTKQDLVAAIVALPVPVAHDAAMRLAEATWSHAGLVNDFAAIVKKLPEDARDELVLHWVRGAVQHGERGISSWQLDFDRMIDAPRGQGLIDLWRELQPSTQARSLADRFWAMVGWTVSKHASDAISAYIRNASYHPPMKQAAALIGVAAVISRYVPPEAASWSHPNADLYATLLASVDSEAAHLTGTAKKAVEAALSKLQWY